MWWLIILGLLLVLIVILLVRTVNYKPKKVEVTSLPKLEVDNELMTKHLQEMIRIPTVSNHDFEKCDKEVFASFPKLLVKNYPLVNEKCDFKKIGNTGLVYHWKGKNSDSPTVLMAHYDVVATGEASKWKHAPFAGDIADGQLWGRGTLDTKITLLGVMEGAERMIKEGYVPEHDIYLCFSGNEEVAGDGAPGIVKYFASINDHPALVVDEGGAIVPDMFPSIPPLAVIGVGEKGMMDLRMSVPGEGGHASHPPVHTALGVLSKAICDSEKHPFKASLSAPIKGLLETVGRNLPFGLQKLALANMWLFGGILKKAFVAQGGELAAMLKTTQSWNMASASPQANIIPNDAKAVCNIRLMNTDSPQQALDHIKQAVNNPKVEFEIIDGMAASPYTDTNSPEYQKVSQAINRTWPNTLVTPYLMIACSDSRHYPPICDHICRFSCMQLDKEQRNMIHNYNERIKLPMIGECVTFYLNLIRTL